MPVIIEELVEKLGPPVLVLAALALVAGLFWGMHEHAAVLEAQRADAVQAASNAEAQRDGAYAARDIAASAAAVSAQAASQVAAADAAQMKLLEQQKQTAIQRAGDLAKLVTEIQNAPHTTACVNSPAIRAALDGVRNAAAAAQSASAVRPADQIPGAASSASAPSVQRGTDAPGRR
jgi:hypothetical protein